MYCPQCGFKNDDNSCFCEQCGTTLKKSETAIVPLSANHENINSAFSENSTKKVNKKYAVAIIIFTVVIGLGICTYSLIDHQQKEKANETYSILLSTAEKAEDSQNYDSAISNYQTAIQQRPDDTKAYIGIADAYIGKNDYDSAAKILHTGYEKTKSAEINSKLCEVNKKLEGIKAAEATKKKARDEAKAKETEYNTQLSEADKALNNGNIFGAQQLYQKAIALNQNNIQVYLDISSHFEKKLDLDDALRTLIQGTKNVDATNQQAILKQIAVVRKEYKPNNLVGKPVSEIKELFGSDFRKVGETQSGGTEFQYDDKRTPYVFGCACEADNIDNILVSMIIIKNNGDYILSDAKFGMTYEQLRKKLTGFQESAPCLDECGDMGNYYAICKCGAYIIDFGFQDSKGPCTYVVVAKDSN